MEPVGPSPWRNPNTGDEVRPLEQAEITEIQKDFVTAARRLWQARIARVPWGDVQPRPSRGATIGTVSMVLATAISSRAVNMALVMTPLSSRMLAKMISIRPLV